MFKRNQSWWLLGNWKQSMTFVDPYNHADLAPLQTLWLYYNVTLPPLLQMDKSNNYSNGHQRVLWLECKQMAPTYFYHENPECTHTQKNSHVQTKMWANTYGLCVDTDIPRNSCTQICILHICAYTHTICALTEVCSSYMCLYSNYTLIALRLAVSTSTCFGACENEIKAEVCSHARAEGSVPKYRQLAVLLLCQPHLPLYSPNNATPARE